MAFSFDIRDLHVNFVWESDIGADPSPWDSPAHFHFLYEAHVIDCGEMDFTVGNTLYHLKSGDFCVVPPNAVHFPMDTETPIARGSVFFTLSKNGESGTLYREYTELLSHPDGIMGRASEDLMFYVRHFGTYRHDKGLLSQHKMKCILPLLFLELCNCMTQSQRAELSGEETDNRDFTELKMKIDAFFNNNYMRDVTLDELAKEIGYSRKQAARLLEKVTGKTFNRFLLSWRMEIARMLITNTEKSLQEISVEVGYETYSGFYRAFLNFFRVTPHSVRGNAGN